MSISSIRNVTDTGKRTGRRVVKSKWFAREAAKFKISDRQLCDAMLEVQQGRADNLGGGVWKKRLNDNRDRSIVVARGARYWIFVYLFHKKDRDNIESDELDSFKILAKAYALYDDALITMALASKELMEICDD